ncbi:DEAD/DEAH box helicase [Quadrisphaera sp. DSM 44207]|uniref:DEAD/DEAH box helicase n=1 Tax=Quadrisphaera sp. DSM 44207 TaxID=1881057 RepID=UPI00088091F8|nr:DEAD/DEAH box helicase [Quadrisphaera sp. DSM 44207]SDQ71964.1 Superfamily II DNA and RNA helicase [Quadrisphaera sp. DSM 44207]
MPETTPAPTTDTARDTTPAGTTTGTTPEPAPLEDEPARDADDLSVPDPAPGEAVEPIAERTFADYGVQPAIVEALAEAGIVHPFPIQAMTLPVALTGHDIIGQAKTGTGKTLGFGIPVLQRAVGPGEPGEDQLQAPGRPQALVVAPTRELAVQVARDLERAAGRRSARVLTVYGGRAYEPQVEALQRGVEVVVGTPGRLLDLAQQGHLSLAHARTVVLDEADEMLDLGFLPDVEKLLSLTPAGRQTMLFSATMPGPVVAMARRYMTQPTHIRAADPDDEGATVKAITQVVYRAHALDKVEVLARIMQAQGRGLSIVFARTKRTAAKVADELVERGFAAAPLHGDLGQGAREQALRAFRNGKVDILVATDVAARGIDVTDVTHVVNYQCPEDEKTYLHRIGRTGRAGATGTAVTFVDWDDLHRWAMIDRALDLGIPEPQETYSTSPHLYDELGIPAGTKGVLPRGARTRAGLAAEAVEDLGETGRRGAGASGAAEGRGRGHQRPGGRGHGGERAADADSERPRERRRTRGGRTAEEHAAAAAVPGEDRAAAAAAAVAAVAADRPGAPEGPGEGGAARRRRRRGGRGRSGGAAGAGSGPAAAGGDAPSAAAPAPAGGPASG